MKQKNQIRKAWQQGILVLDGAIGTELQKRGLPPGVCPEEWCLSHHEIISELHSSYGRAGARIVFAATFGANRFKLGQYGLQNKAREINRELALLARQSVGGDVLVAGDIGPTGLFIEPFGPLPLEEAIEAFKEQASGLIAGGVNLFVVETMIDIQEARAALLAIKELGDYFTIVTVTLEKNGRTLNGTDPVSALITLQALGADAVGCNCSAGPEAMIEFISAMKPYATVPLVAKPNAGMPLFQEGKTVYPMGPREFASFAPAFARAGVNMLGGCCGTTPEHIREISAGVAGLTVLPPRRRSLSAVSSARAHQILDRTGPLMVIGERINPTGKRQMQQELLAGRTSEICRMAREQEKQGAHLLDVNVGMPGIDEAAAMRQAIGALATATRLPLVIDSGDVRAVETALRIYPGRAVVNSVSWEKEKIKRLLPLAARYGAMIIILPLTGKEVPETALERKAIIRRIFAESKGWGFTKEDVIIDALVMTAASHSHAAKEALEVVAWCNNEFKCASLLGLTNISFGMPGRPWLNAAYLAMAQAQGLTLAIANPASEELMQIKLAADVLTGKDINAAAFIARLKGHARPAGGKEERASSPRDRVFKAVREGNREDMTGLIEEALGEGEKASELIEQVLMKAISEVGELFEEKVYFLPQLIASAEAMKLGMARLEEELQKEAVRTVDRGTIILATVQGDIHDIGKNIVGLLLKNNGYKIIDLGKDVPAEVIIDAIKRHKPLAVGLSALMTTTMANMKVTINLTRQEGLDCPFILGGAVVTEAYARPLGALYARDGVEALRVLATLAKLVK